MAANAVNPPISDAQGPAQSPWSLSSVSRTMSAATSVVVDTTRTVLSPNGIRGTAREAAWVAAHAAMYPFGFVEEKSAAVLSRFNLAGLAPEQRGLWQEDVETAAAPILLLHGVADNHSVFAVLQRALRRKGFARVITLDYSPFSGDIRDVAARLEELVEAVCDETGHDRVHIVAHSMGGIVARYYIQRLGGDGRVANLVTLGTPHGGTAPAALAPLPIIRQLRIGSDLLNELAEPSPNCQTTFVSIWSDLDQMVVPQANGRLDHPDLNATNIAIHGLGHMSLPVDRRVVDEICRVLTCTR